MNNDCKSALELFATALDGLKQTVTFRPVELSSSCPHGLLQAMNDV